MTARSRIDLRIAAAFCGAIGLYDVLYVIFEWSRGPQIGLVIDPFPDFLVFHAAARAFFEGKLALVYDTDAFTAGRRAPARPAAGRGGDPAHDAGRGRHVPAGRPARLPFR